MPVAAPAQRPAVFFDRDGVLNETVERDGQRVSPRSVRDLRLVAGAAEGVAALRAAGYRIFIVTNQPDLARGKMLASEHEAIMRCVEEAIGPDDVAVCAHDDAERCRCRKPEPGMITALARKWGIDLARSYVIGDSWRDVEAGQRAGCRTILVTSEGRSNLQPDVVVSDTLAAITAIFATTPESA